MDMMTTMERTATERRTMSLPVHLQSSHLPLGDQRTGRLYGKDVLSVAQFCRDDLDYIFGAAEAMRTMVADLAVWPIGRTKAWSTLIACTGRSCR